MPKKKVKAKKSQKPKKAKPAKKKVAKKAVAKKAKPKAKAKVKAKKTAKSAPKPKAKPKSAAKAASKPAPKAAKPSPKPAVVQTGPKPVPPSGGYPIGRVVHFFDRISVAIVTLTGKLTVGDKILFKRGEREFLQKIKSIQVHHAPLQVANAGQVVGLKVDKIAPEGTWLLRP